MENIYSFLELVNDNTEPPEPIIDGGILLSKTLLLIVGKEKIGKSFLSCNMATAMTSGIDFAGFKINSKQKVMILSAEGGYFQNRDRIKKMASEISEKDLAMAHFYMACNIKIDNPDDYLRIESQIEQRGINVLIIDPLIRFHTQDENSSTGMSIIMGKIRELIENMGISVIVIHHTGKRSSLGARGSSVIMGEYDSAIYIDRRRSDHLGLSFDTRHVETPPNSQIVFNPDTFWFEKPKQEVDAVVKFIQENGSIKRNNLVDNWVKSGKCSKTHAYRLIKQAFKQELIKMKNGELVLEES